MQQLVYYIPGSVERVLDAGVRSLGHRAISALSLIRHGEPNLQLVPWPWVAVGVVVVKGGPWIKLRTAATVGSNTCQRRSLIITRSTSFNSSLRFKFTVEGDTHSGLEATKKPLLMHCLRISGRPLTEMPTHLEEPIGVESSLAK